MMAGTHPSDLELLELVEGNLDADAAASVRSHVAACTTCTATIAELERARAVLRAAPVFELPAERGRAILAGLPAQEPEPRPKLAFLRSPRRLALVLAPVAVAVVAVTVTLTTTGGDGANDEALRQAARPPAAEAQGEAAPPAEAAKPAPTSAGTGTGGAIEAPMEAGAAPVVSVAGRPEEIVRMLEDAGYRARVVQGTVEVTGATEEEIRGALRDLPAGDVPVVLASG